MAEYAIASNNTEEVVGTLAPVDADGEAVALAAPPSISRESGDADAINNSLTPNEIIYRSGTAAGPSVFRVSGSDVHGNVVEDVVTYNVSEFVPPVSPLTSLGQTFAPPRQKS